MESFTYSFSFCLVQPSSIHLQLLGDDAPPQFTTFPSPSSKNIYFLVVTVTIPFPLHGLSQTLNVSNIFCYRSPLFISLVIPFPLHELNQTSI